MSTDLPMARGAIDAPKPRDLRNVPLFINATRSRWVAATTRMSTDIELIAPAGPVRVLAERELAGLRSERAVTDFVAEQRPAIGIEHQAPLAFRRRAGERSSLVAESFAFDKAFRQRRAIHGDARRVGWCAVIVYALVRRAAARLARAGRARCAAGIGRAARRAANECKTEDL